MPFQVGPVVVREDGNSLYWCSGLKIDADGGVFSYGPRWHPGLDFLGNANTDPRNCTGDWCGLACNKAGIPYVQGPDEPNPQGYVSTTALQDHSQPVWRTARYVDSGTIPYISIPRELLHAGVQLGDLGMGLFVPTQLVSFFIVADVGPRGKLGEGSMQFAKNIGISSDPKHGGIDGGVCQVVFRGTSRGWPRAQGEMVATVAPMFEAWGGRDRLAMV